MNVRPLLAAALLLTLSTPAARAGETNRWPVTLDTYPEEFNLRPLTLPAGVVEAGLDLDVARASAGFLPLGTTPASTVPCLAALLRLRI